MRSIKAFGLLTLSMICNPVLAEWDSLFNGTDLTGWRNYQSSEVSSQWVVEEGELRLAGRGAGDLVYIVPYQDFDLSVDWKISEGGNSGIFFLADEQLDRIYFNAPEVQILDDARHPDGHLENHRSGSLYDLIASPDESHRAAGEWNTTRIRVKARNLTIWHNGIHVTDIRMDSEQWNNLVANSKFKKWLGFGRNLSGLIGLQDHGDPVSFKNIKIQDLSE